MPAEKLFKLKRFSKLRIKQLWDDLRIFCLPRDTLVWTTPNLSLIENIESNKVQSLTGFQKIIGWYKRKFEGNLVSLKISHLGWFRLSPEHKILAANVSKDKSRRKFGLGIRHKGAPYRKGKTFKKPWWEFKESWVAAQDLKRDEFAVKVPIPLTKPTECPEELFELAGWYLAEGFKSGPYSLRFSLSRKEEKYAKRILFLFRKITGKTSGSYRILDKEIRITICGKDLVNFFISQFGSGAQNKVIPQWAIEAEPSKIKKLLSSWELGDGWKFQSCQNIVTVSKKLAYSAFLSYLKLGIVPSLCHIRIKNHDNFLTDGQCPYQLSYYPNGHKNPGVWKKDNFYYFQVKNVTRVPYCGELFDLEVKNESAFAIPFLVHNSAWYASKKRGKVIRDRKTGKIITFQEIIKRFAKTRALLIILGYPMVKRKRKAKVKKTTKELYRLALPLIKRYVRFFLGRGVEANKKEPYNKI